MKKKILNEQELEYLRAARVARLGTASKDGIVSVVPVVFAVFENRIYFVVDRKKKNKDDGRELRRIKNMRETGKATLLIDNYSENWSELSYLLVQCNAKIIGPGEDQTEKILARIILKEKYKQYSGESYFPEKIEEATFVRLEPIRSTFWQNLREPLA